MLKSRVGEAGEGRRKRREAFGIEVVVHRGRNGEGARAGEGRQEYRELEKFFFAPVSDLEVDQSVEGGVYDEVDGDRATGLPLMMVGKSCQSSL